MNRLHQLLAPLLFCVVGIAACQTDPWEHHFVVPVDYRGPFAVVTHPSFENLGSTQATEEGHVHFVPPTAVVCVADDRIFHAIHITAEYSDGSPIPVLTGTSPQNAPSGIMIDGFGAWGGGPESGVYWFGVGTYEELAAMKRAFFSLSYQLPTMMPSGVSMGRLDDFQEFGRYCEGSP